MSEGRARLELELKPSTIVLLDRFARQHGYNRASAISWLIRAQDVVERGLQDQPRRACAWWRPHSYGAWSPVDLRWQARRCTRCGWRQVR